MANKSKKIVVAAAPSTSSRILTPGEIRGTDFNPRSLESVSGASRKDIGYESQTEPRLESHMEMVEENAAYVSEHWQERIRKEGVTYYVCPLCSGAAQKMFFGDKGQKECAAHIKEEHPSQVKLMKMKKAPKEAYQPQKKVQSPKRTIADAVHPKFRAVMEASIKQREMLAPISDHARSLSVHGSPMLKLVTMTESMAIQKLRSLNDKDLAGIVQLARNRGKRLLARAAAAMCQKKGINPDMKVNDPSPRYMLIQEALKNANIPAQVARRG